MPHRVIGRVGVDHGVEDMRGFAVRAFFSAYGLAPFRLPQEHSAASGERSERAGKRAGHTPRGARPQGAELHKRRSRAEANRVEPAASPLTLPRSRDDDGALQVWMVQVQIPTNPG